MYHASVCCPTSGFGQRTNTGDTFKIGVKKKAWQTQNGSWQQNQNQEKLKWNEDFPSLNTKETQVNTKTIKVIDNYGIIVKIGLNVKIVCYEDMIVLLGVVIWILIPALAIFFRN